jgi:hypothetical protein
VDSVEGIAVFDIDGTITNTNSCFNVLETKMWLVLDTLGAVMPCHVNRELANLSPRNKVIEVIHTLSETFDIRFLTTRNLYHEPGTRGFLIKNDLPPCRVYYRPIWMSPTDFKIDSIKHWRNDIIIFVDNNHQILAEATRILGADRVRHPDYFNP